MKLPPNKMHRLNSRLISNLRLLLIASGASNHPPRFRNADREYLIRQGNNSGTFGEDADVNVVKSGNDISFTLTEALASQITQYICVFHPGMSGEIAVIE